MASILTDRICITIIQFVDVKQRYGIGYNIGY